MKHRELRNSNCHDVLPFAHFKIRSQRPARYCGDMARKQVFLIAIFVSLQWWLAAEPVTISVNTLQSGPAIPADSLGLSYETSLMLPDAQGIHYFRPDNKPLVALFKTIGVKSLRIGGNSVDAPNVPLPSEADLTAFFDFAKAAGVKVIYSVRLEEPKSSDATNGSPASSPGSIANAQSAARFAKLIHDHYSDVLDCFAIGNEPDYFRDYAVYSAKWKAIHDAIVSVYSGAKFCGPDQNPSPQLDARMAHDFATAGLIKITQHSYPFGCAYKNPQARANIANLIPFDAAASREKMLSPKAYDTYEKIYKGIAGAITNTPLAYRLTEVNSYWFSGLQGASDSYASALWAPDYLHWWTGHGADGLNFHTGDRTGGDLSMPCQYAAFVTSANGYEARPLAYGMKLFALGGHGRQLPIANSASTNLVAYATLDSKTIFITLINKAHGPDAKNSEIQIELDAPIDESNARAIFLEAKNSDIAATSSGVTLGGASIREDGSWNGRWMPVKITNNKLITISTPPASAAVIQASLRPREK